MGAIWGHLWWAGVGETPVSQDCLPPPEVIVQGCSPLGHLHQHGTSFLPASSLAASPGTFLLVYPSSPWPGFQVTSSTGTAVPSKQSERSALNRDDACSGSRMDTQGSLSQVSRGSKNLWSAVAALA